MLIVLHPYGAAMSAAGVSAFRKPRLAEHFRGRLRAIHTTSGGGELFLRALATYGEKVASDDASDAACLAFIRERLSKGNGWYHIAVYPLPHPLQSLPSLLFLVRAVRGLTQALVDDRLPPTFVDDFYDRHLRLRWAAFALEFYDLIQESVDLELPDISPKYQDAKESSIVSINRLRLRLTDAQKIDTPQEQLKLLSEIISLECSLNASENLWSMYLQKAELELKLGDTESAIASLNKGAAHADGEAKELLIQMADGLQSP